MEVKMENKSYRYDINRPKRRHGHKYTNNIKCVFNMMILICIKLHLSNICSSIHGKVKQHWGWAKACRSQRLSELVADNTILFWIKFFGRKN